MTDLEARVAKLERALATEGNFNTDERAFWDSCAERVGKLEAAVVVYDRLGVELVASLAALKGRVNALEDARKAEIVGPS